jgi:hypothetical protein
LMHVSVAETIGVSPPAAEALALAECMAVCIAVSSVRDTGPFIMRLASAA